MTRRAIASVVIAVMLGAPVGVSGMNSASAQGSIGSRIDAVQRGKVRMSFAARAGVCGDGWSWYRSRSSGSVSGTFSNYNGGNDVEPNCPPGPVRVVLVREGGETREIRTYVGGRWKSDTGVTDLGAVSANEAARYLIGHAERATERTAGSALSAATLADSVDAASALLRIASDEKRPSGVRSSALGWLGEVAGEKVAARLDSLAYEPGDREVRKQAIFAISRRPADEAATSLIKMAESLPDRELRRTAVFWLARVKDPRALEWIRREVEK